MTHPDQPYTGAFDASGRRVTEPGAPDRADVASALFSLGSCVAGSPADWAADSRSAWIYGIVLGWDCEEGHAGHDEGCGGDAAMRQVAARFGWDDAEVARLRGYRRAVAEALREVQWKSGKPPMASAVASAAALGLSCPHGPFA